MQTYVQLKGLDEVNYDDAGIVYFFLFWGGHMAKENEEVVKVVVVDDEPLIRMDLEEMLEAKGYHVVGSAGDGFEAIRLCQETKPDLVLLDVTMPLLDGLAAARYIKEEELAETVILVTAYCNEEFVTEANEIGVSGYLVKPINENSFIPTLRIALARSREMQMLKKEVLKVRSQIEARKMIEKAKGYIMMDLNLNEKEAYDYIRNISKEKRISMSDVAEIILKGRKKKDENQD